MTGIVVKCTKGCKEDFWVANIIELFKSRDSRGFFKCPCGHDGYVEKSFNTQEGELWAPFLRGAISLGQRGDFYQPFVYLVTYKPDAVIKEDCELWFAYYKDMRPTGGRLKLGYGPGGPPVFDAQDLLSLLSQLVAIEVLSRSDVENALSPAAGRAGWAAMEGV
jgi:hypothetical protein